MKILLNSVLVEDQGKALSFYTEVLGFVKKTDLDLGEFRWLTVISSESHDDVELVLEPNVHPMAKAFQQAMKEDGIPATAFAVDDLAAEHERLIGLGVAFPVPPRDAGGVMVAVFDDTCGNLIQLYQE